jgi:hypothetical protein
MLLFLDFPMSGMESAINNNIKEEDKHLRKEEQEDHCEKADEATSSYPYTQLLEDIAHLLRENNVMIKHIESTVIQIKEDTRKIRYNTQ